MAMAEPEKKSIVMFPFMAYGHLNPFMALARQLERRKGYKITIVNTPLNIKKLRSSLPPNSNISFAEIPFNVGADYGLPAGTENTDNLCYGFMIPFLIASENLKTPFKNLLVDISRIDGHAPVCVISDMFLGWTVEVAKELGIFHSVFIAGAGYSMAVYFSISLNMRGYCPEKDEFSLLDFPEASKIQRSQLGNDLIYTGAAESWWTFKEKQFLFCLSSDAILLNTIDGLGGAIGAKYFSWKMEGKPVWMIGPACNNSDTVKKDHKNMQIESIFSWLDLQAPDSVLYVCFGSQNAILPSQVRELALGLEASEKPFIWVVRPPIGFSTATEDLQAEWFPEGFVERIRRKNQGLLVYKWVPQLKILSHKSTGAFLSHCGWNSVLESLCHGVPIIGWPLVGEQMFNSKMLEDEAGVCMEVAQGIVEGNVKCEHIAEVIKMGMEEINKGGEMRRKACEMKVKLEEAIKESEGFKGSSIRAMDEFLNTASKKYSTM
ncbi:hypothetical protein EZV62_011936 [Acer yangbiense]|uniref:Glycosyltransferase n=1 Tax=Acer yangbiense TaxID=1000413 RepID=A0A5C7I8L0_9ROSI|nr:hypothetical protein EZV62_011936 [Acer yangbiense]